MDKNAAHGFMSREEFDRFMEASPRWQAIKEDLFARAYEDLRTGEFENSGGVLLTTVMGIRGQSADSIKIFHINLLIKDNENEPGIGDGESPL